MLINEDIKRCTPNDLPPRQGKDPGAAPGAATTEDAVLAVVVRRVVVVSSTARHWSGIRSLRLLALALVLFGLVQRSAFLRQVAID